MKKNYVTCRDNIKNILLTKKNHTAESAVLKHPFPMKGSLGLLVSKYMQNLEKIHPDFEDPRLGVNVRQAEPGLRLSKSRNPKL